MSKPKLGGKPSALGQRHESESRPRTEESRSSGERLQSAIEDFEATGPTAQLNADPRSQPSSWSSAEKWVRHRPIKADLEQSEKREGGPPSPFRSNFLSYQIACAIWQNAKHQDYKTNGEVNDAIQ
jgi:hypothetical protein